MPKPAGRGESTQPAAPTSPGCHQRQGVACSTLTGEGGVPAFRGGRKARRGQGGRAEGAGGAGWATPPAPWTIAYLDGAFSPRKPGKGQVEQAPGWGRCGADPGKPGASPCTRQRLPAGGDAAPGGDGHPHPGAAGALPPPWHPRVALVPAGETGCCLRPHAGSPSSTWGPRNVPHGAVAPRTPLPQQHLGFPIPNPKHQIFQSISCTHAGRGWASTALVPTGTHREHSAT